MFYLLYNYGFIIYNCKINIYIIIILYINKKYNYHIFDLYIYIYNILIILMADYMYKFSSQESHIDLLYRIRLALFSISLSHNYLIYKPRAL